LDVAGDQVDAVRFERHARAARESVRAGRCSDAANEAAAGLALWRGEPVPELDDHPLGTAERVRLEELRRGLREDQTEAAIVLGHPAVGECEALISEDPLRERPWRLLLHALARDGRIAEALERYRDHRRLLADELGLEPSDEMEQLQLRLLAG